VGDDGDPGALGDCLPIAVRDLICAQGLPLVW
jgi:hypothetical protein